MKTILAIASGGCMGAVARYWIGKALASAGRFPWGTLVVNLSGAFVIGFCYALFRRMQLPAETRLFITTGFLGAFTTFSTFALENLTLLQAGQIRTAVLNILVSNICGILLAYLGCTLAGLLIPAKQ